MQFPYPSCPLEILTKYINKKCIEKGLKCMEPDPKNIPGHTINYREVRIMNGDEMPANWYKLLPESVEIHYRNPEMEHSTYTLTGSINHIEHHHGINDFHLNTTIEDRVALAKDAIHKCTFHLVCHIHDPEYLYHFKPWDANKAKEETTFVIEKKIALPTCKYTSSFQEHKDEKTCNSKEKIFHIIHEEVHTCLYTCLYICLYVYVYWLVGRRRWI